MKKLGNNQLAMVLMGVAAIILMIGIYFIYSGVEAKQNEQQLLTQIEDMNKVNKSLQSNYDKIKELMQNKEEDTRKNQDEIMNSNEITSASATSFIDIKDDFDSIMGTYKNDKYPPNLDVESIEQLQILGLNSMTLKRAYEIKVNNEGYPEELEGEVTLDKVEYIDATSCLVQLSNSDIDMKLIYELDYDFGGIIFRELKRTVGPQIHSSSSNYTWQLSDDFYQLISRYQVSDWKLLDNEFVLQNQQMSYSPDGRYIMTMNFPWYSLSMGTNNDPKVQLIIKNKNQNEIKYVQDLEIINNFQTYWKKDSSRFVALNHLYYDLENVKEVNLRDNIGDDFVLRAVCGTKDFINKFVSTYEPDTDKTSLICKVYDWNNSYIKDVYIFQIDGDIDLYNYNEIYIRTIFDNIMTINVVTQDDQFIHKIDIEKDLVIKNISYLEDYVYINELGWKMRETYNDNVVLIIENENGDKVQSITLDNSVINGYLGIDENNGLLYFNNYNESIGSDYGFEDFYIFAYDYNSNVMNRISVPLDHLTQDDMVTGGWIWFSKLENGVLELYTYVPVKNE